MPDPTATIGRRTYRETALVALLLIATATVLGKDITAGGFRHGDSAVHAMDGVLIHDWLKHGRDDWLHPIKFAEQQYAHYPTLGIGRHYPPGFAIVEAAFFAVFGLSPVTARLCVVFFGLLAAGGAYVYIRSFADRTSAILGTVALITMPATTRWGRQTMLELPTVAVLIWSAVACSYYWTKPTWRRLWLVLAVSATAILFKQPAVFLIGAWASTLLVGVLRGQVRLTHFVVAAATALTIGSLVFLSLDGHGSKLWRGLESFEARWSIPALTFYLRALPRQVGLGVLAAALIGLVVSMGPWLARAMHLPATASRFAVEPARAGADRRGAVGLQGVFLVFWFVTCYGLLTLADYKNARFFFPGLFPLAVWAGLGGGFLLQHFRMVRIRTAAVSVVSLALCATALGSPVERRPDYGPVVLAHRDQIAGRAVLFSGLRDGDFVFAVRQNIPWRKAVVIRGSKLLYTCNGRPELDFVSKIGSAEDLNRMMRRFAFRTIFLERENKLGLREDALLRDYLRNSEGHRLAASYRFPMDTRPTYRDTTVDVYEAVTPLSRRVDHFDIQIPRSHRVVRVDLTGWS